MPVTSASALTTFNTYFNAAAGKLANVRAAISADSNDGMNTDYKTTGRDGADIVDSLKNFKSATAQLKTHFHHSAGNVHLRLDIHATTVEEFHAILKQAADGLSAVATQAGSDNWRDNTLPTCTTMASVIGTVAAETETELTLAEIKAQANESADTTAFVVEAVSTGTLKIGASALTATAWAAGTNDVIDATNNAYWTSAEGASGTTNAFTVKAMDATGWKQSTAAVQCTMTVT